jgi:signal transduction histidine kinase
VSQGIVEAHDGDIELATTIGVGTTVQVRLPRAVAPNQDSSSTLRSQPSPIT